jgi:hypothetical protein
MTRHEAQTEHMRNACTIPFEKPQAKRLGCAWEDNIKLNCREIYVRGEAAH